jgi:predicted phosphodiesterase
LDFHDAWARPGVRHSLERLRLEAVRRGAAVALFGHTHRQLCETNDGLTVMNPGSLSRPRDAKRGYGVVEIVGGQAMCHLVGLK